MRLIKSLTAILLCFSLLFCCACEKKVIAPDKEVSVNESAARPTTPQVITEEVEAASGQEAVLTDEQIARAYSYGYLSEQEKRIYRIMLNMVQHLTVGWINVGLVEGDQSASVAKAYRAMCNDFPEYYWMPISYYITVNGTSVAVAFKRNDMEDGYGFIKEDIEKNKVDFDDAIDYIMDKVDKAEGDFEKEVLIHDLLCKNVIYDSEEDVYEPASIYTAYGALVNGLAVCEGYARAFKLLCYYAGRDCILVTGDSKGVGHMWNMVQLEGNWYHVDVTWDDLRSEPHHTYLNLTEMEIRADHDIDINYSDAPSSLITQGNSYNFFVPKAESTSLNYFIKKGLVIKDDPITFIATELVARYKAGEKKGEFLFADSAVADDFKNNYETYVVEIQNECVSQTGRVKFKLKTLSFPGNNCVLYFEEA